MKAGEHRLARYEMAGHLLKDLFTEGARNDFLVEQGIPADAQLWWCGYDHKRNVFSFTVEHRSFDLVADGDLIPERRIRIEKLR